MGTILIDTSALHALNYARDDNHARALVFFKELAGRVKPILTEYIFVETMNLTKARLGPDYAIAFGRHLRASRAFYPLSLTEADKRATWEIFEHYRDKSWSYVDCSVLAVARRLQVRRVFTFDHHFEQMGLSIVP